MYAAVLAAALCGQLPTPQAPCPSTAPLTLLVVQQPAAVATVTPSVLVSQPPVWDRALSRAGQYLTERAARHQHPRPVQLLVVAPSAACPAAPPMGRALPPPVPPRLSAQISAAEAAPPPPILPSASSPAPPVMLSIDPAKLDDLRRMLDTAAVDRGR